MRERTCDTTTNRSLLAGPVVTVRYPLATVLSKVGKDYGIQGGTFRTRVAQCDAARLRTRVTNVTKMAKTHAHAVQQARIVVTTPISQRVDTAESVGPRVGC